MVSFMFSEEPSGRGGILRAWNSFSRPAKRDSLVYSSGLQPGVIFPQGTFDKEDTFFIVPNWRVLLASSG